MPLYRDHYFIGQNVRTLRTRDLDLLVPLNAVFHEKADVPAMMADLGFVTDFCYPEGFVRLDHPELILEFLVPEKGRGTTKPFPLLQLGMNAPRLRTLELLLDEPIEVRIEGIKVRLPHPVNYGIQKLLAAARRFRPEKRGRDIEVGIHVLTLAVEHGDRNRIKACFEKLSVKQKKVITAALANSDADNIITGE